MIYVALAACLVLATCTLYLWLDNRELHRRQATLLRAIEAVTNAGRSQSDVNRIVREILDRQGEELGALSKRLRIVNGRPCQ